MKKGTILIIVAGIFWGSMGIFVRVLTDWGFTSAQIASMRMVVAALAYSAILAVREPKGFGIRPGDIPLFLASGLCSVLFFTLCYFRAINMMSMSAAAVLLYTSPIWVMLMSAVFFGEKVTLRKLAALATAFAGCVLVSGIGSGASLSGAGIVLGILSGVGYGLYSIFGTVALRKYSAYTFTAYTFIVAAVGSLTVCNLPDMLARASAVGSVWKVAGMVVLTGVVSCVVPYICYTLGLKQVEAGRAAILATTEPLIATILGAAVYRETPTVMSALGVVCILSSIIILNAAPGTEKTE